MEINWVVDCKSGTVWGFEFKPILKFCDMQGYLWIETKGKWCDLTYKYQKFDGDWKDSLREYDPQLDSSIKKRQKHSATDFLHRAASIMEERGKQYDQPEGERSMGKCVSAFNTITGKNLTEAEGWLLLQILKDVRQWLRPGYHADSAEDCIAYAALKAEAKQQEKSCK